MRDRPAVGRVSASAVSAPTAPASRWRDIGAGLCVAGLLLPEAVAGSMGRIVAWAQLRSAGRDGSAIADALIDFGLRRKWKQELLSASQDCAVQVHNDAAAYNAAWDGGVVGA